MKVEQNISLKPYNSFGIETTAEQFANFNSAIELQELFDAYGSLPHFILGGGSNILLLQPLKGIVLRNQIKGITIVEENEAEVVVAAGGGEVWNDLVMYAVSHGFGGIENLSLIPGCVGAAPIQNIGAYGVEQKDCFESLDAYLIHDKTIKRFHKNECAFEYRDSIFKNELKGAFVILTVRYRLKKKAEINIEYGSIKEELSKSGVIEPTIKDVSQAVITIRKQKLPDPAVIGNAGSFFKNPVISVAQFEKLKNTYPGIPSFPSGELIKIPAAWLIEQSGWKGYRKGDAGCHVNQPLVLVNYGNATGEEIYNLSEEILQSVKEKFEIEMEREVNVVV